MTKDDSVRSVVEYGTSPGHYTSSAEGEAEYYRYVLYKSANIHYVVIGPLEADTMYYYRCGGNGPEYSFKTPPTQFPITFAVVVEFQKNPLACMHPISSTLYCPPKLMNTVFP